MRKFYPPFLVLSLWLLVACGQKGPLYLEEKSTKKATETQQPAEKDLIDAEKAAKPTQ